MDLSVKETNHDTIYILIINIDYYNNIFFTHCRHTDNSIVNTAGNDIRVKNSFFYLDLPDGN